MASIQDRYETFVGEQLKSGAELSLSMLGASDIGQSILEAYAFGSEGRIVDPRLQTNFGDIDLENPVMFGAGWDKKGRAVKGLNALGFSGGDVGTILVFDQKGNPKPRLWTIDDNHSVGLNRLGFNSPGMEVVRSYLDKTGPVDFPIGANVGKNKLMPNKMAPWAHAEVIKYLGGRVSYIVLGLSSPNTPDLRALQDKGPLRDNIQASFEAMGGVLPLWLKIDSERSEGELDDIMEVAIEEGVTGLVACNTYMGSDLKGKYGLRWREEAGGLSGADDEYRARTTSVIRRIYEQAGDELDIIGAGGVSDAMTAIDKMRAGASAVQVVTAIRPSKGKVAANIIRGMVEYMDEEGWDKVTDLIGVDTDRGSKAA